MRRSYAGLRFAFVLAVLTPAIALAAQEPAPVEPSVQQTPELYTVDELDNLLAPIALYPDPILAQVLVAATFPDEIALAARYVSEYGVEGIDDQAWDVSVKAVAHYAPVLNMLAERPNWATALGQAYALQPGDVMASVQGLRRMARAQGNLVSTAEQRVEVEPQAIRIVPARPTVIYVPTYDPDIIYYQPVYYARARTPYWSFGVAFPIGVWLTYDVDWGHHEVYYHGWHGYGRSYTWYHASRPYISFNSIYVNPWRPIVIINRSVVHHYVDYRDFRRYNSVHRTVAWDRRGLPGRGYTGRPPKKTWAEQPLVPTVAHRPAPDAGRRGRPGGERPSAPGADRRNKPTDDNRVVPTRIGGTNRPLYTPSEDISPDRVKGGVAKGGVAKGGVERGGRVPTAGSGTWNARPTTPRAEPSRQGGVARPPKTYASTPSPSWDATPSRKPSAAVPARTVPRAVPRSVPRAESGNTPRSVPRVETRSAPRSVPRVESRGTPRSAPRSGPSVSKPTKSVGKGAKGGR